MRRLPYAVAVETAFILPPGSPTGAAFARSLAAALAALGHGASVSQSDDPQAALRDLESSTTPVIDGLLLPRLAGFPDLRRAVALVHHLGALDAQAERQALSAVARIVASSDDAATRLVREFGVEHGRIRVVVPGVNNEARSSGSGLPGCAILAVGALTERKGHDILLRALARLPDLDWRLTIAGDCRREAAWPDQLDALADELGIRERVQTVPEPDDAELETLWRHADLFALAPRWEGYPAAVAEALRRGLPVATTRAAGSLVPPDAGVIAAVEEPEQLSKGMRRLIFDAGLRATMAEAAWQAGQRLPGWQDQARRFLQGIADSA